MLAHITDEIIYRSIKVFGNAVKSILTVHLGVFPNYRGVIPDHVAPSKPVATDKAIPRIIWQTNYTNRVTLQILMNFKFNRYMSPEFEYRFCGDDECDAFVRENYPGEIYQAYASLQVGAAKADFWRILVLLKHGGVYLDIDSNFASKPERFIPDDAQNMFIAMKDGEVTNYFLAGAPGDPVLAEISKRILRNIQEGTLASVYDMTGPTVVDAVVREMGAVQYYYKKICTQGQFTNKRGQYRDKPRGAWWMEQEDKPIVQRPD